MITHMFSFSYCYFWQLRELMIQKAASVPEAAQHNQYIIFAIALSMLSSSNFWHIFL